jgi:hypothetical protein
VPRCDTTHEKNQQPYAEDAKDSQRTQRKPMDLLAFCVLCEISALSAFGGWRFPMSNHSKSLVSQAITIIREKSPISFINQEGLARLDPGLLVGAG